VRMWDKRMHCSRKWLDGVYDLMRRCLRRRCSVAGFAEVYCSTCIRSMTGTGVLLKSAPESKTNVANSVMQLIEGKA
jgi:hypothetical protein